MGSSRASNCRDDFEALTQGVARLQEGSVSVGFLGGEDHLSWLQGQVTQDLRELQVGEVVWSCLCTRSGMLRAVLRVGRTVEGLLLVSDAEGLDAVEDLVRESVFLEDVTWSRGHAPAACSTSRSRFGPARRNLRSPRRSQRLARHPRRGQRGSHPVRLRRTDGVGTSSPKEVSKVIGASSLAVCLPFGPRPGRRFGSRPESRRGVWIGTTRPFRPNWGPSSNPRPLATPRDATWAKRC
ncbi:MAG: tRNA-modifying protein YgfZ [Armatimonadetes bacterium OLB18]|nr:MAG: tRNA-modifying protein YgfZ [Armatimonadetes bacterium OLB18]